jgi:shikimate kinase
LRTANPRETLRELYEDRQPHYAEADLVVDASTELSVEGYGDARTRRVA